MIFVVNVILAVLISNALGGIALGAQNLTNGEQKNGSTFQSESIKSKKRSERKNQCIHPLQMDGGNGRSSDISGKITDFEKGNKVIFVGTKKGQLEIDLSSLDINSLNSQFGGVIGFEELKIGEKVDIWSLKCKPIQKGSKVIPEQIVVYKE